MPIQDSQSVQSFIFKLKLENNSKAIDLLYCLFEMEIQESICSLWPAHSDNNERIIVVVCRDVFVRYKRICDNCQSVEGLMVSILIDIIKDPRLRTTIDMSNDYCDIAIRSLAIMLNEKLWASETLSRDAICI
jgi:hypothetical protein